MIRLEFAGWLLIAIISVGLFLFIKDRLEAPCLAIPDSTRLACLER